MRISSLRRGMSVTLETEGLMTVQEGAFRDARPSRKSRVGRPPKGRRAMSEAERAKAYRRRKTARAQREAARKAREEADRSLAKRTNGSYAVHHVDINGVTPEMVPDASVDAIITDPPYPPEFLPTFSDLSRFAARVLKPGGWCVVMTGAVF